MMETPINPQNLPARIMTSEVLKLARYGHTKLRKKLKSGEFPQPIDRGKQLIWNRDEVLIALGYIEPQQGIAHNDPFKKGLQELGPTHG